MSISDYSHHGEDAAHVWAAEQNEYDGEYEHDDHYADIDDWDYDEDE